MLDIDGRRPIVLEAALAREWIEPKVPVTPAVATVPDHVLSVEAFEWFAVDRGVSNVHNGGQGFQAADDPVRSRHVSH